MEIIGMGASLKQRAASLAATLLAILVLLSPAHAHSSLTVLIGEPYGTFGTMLPVGHAAIYLDRVCADTPLVLRMCRPDEPMGVVLSRYHHLREYDWVASPVMEYLYAVERPDQVPKFVTQDLENELREQFRQTYLQTIIPDGTEHQKHENEWPETVGAALDRRLWGYQINTSAMQDERLVAILNARANHRLYRVRTANCADFVSDIVNFYFPDAVRANRVADWGIITPKHLARSMAAFRKTYPEAQLRTLEIPQIPGTLRRSRPTWGISEFFLKTKRYSAALAVIQPEAVIAALVTYESTGRFELGLDAETITPQFWAGQGSNEVTESPAKLTAAAGAGAGGGAAIQQ